MLDRVLGVCRSFHPPEQSTWKEAEAAAWKRKLSEDVMLQSRALGVGRHSHPPIKKEGMCLAFLQRMYLQVSM